MLLRRYHTNNGKKEDIGVATTAAPKSLEKAKNPAPTLTAEDIKSMSGAKLRKLAAENGIENPEELTVGELKAVLIEKFS